MPIIPENKTLFVIDLAYQVPFDQIDPLIDGHMAFLEECYAEGLFLASGPKVPREGGVILAVSDSRQRIEEVIKKDPFHQEEVAIYTITEFIPRMTHPGLR